MMPDGPGDAFLRWWFEPWRYGGPPLSAYCDSVLAQRDGYRHWCAQAGVVAELPHRPQLEWQAAVCTDRAQLLRAAELFGGLLAARRHRQEELALLAPALRRWCLAVALTQPLADWRPDLPAGLRGPRGRGLSELALRMEHVFPGMWSRLRLLLPDELAAAVSAALTDPAPASATPALPVAPPAVRERDRRCWLMCLAQGAMA